MKKLLLMAGLFLIPGVAFAQSATQVPTCANVAPPAGSGGLYVDTTGSLCVRGNLGGFQTLVQSTPTTQSAAYASGQSIGGLITLTNATKLANTGLIQSVGASFTSGVQPSLDVVFFNANPTASTITDKTAVAIATADLGKVVAVSHLTDATLLGSSSPSYIEALQQAIPFATVSANTLYAVVISRSAATLTSTTDMTLSLRILQD